MTDNINKTQNRKLSHVALLVPSARKASNYLKQFDFKIENEQFFETVGTLEIYVERDKGNSLLLMEAIAEGPYKQALNKRGPGLHHIAIDVESIELFIKSITGSGWLLQLQSLTTIKHQTVYLARPGFPCLIEVQQKNNLSQEEIFVNEIGLSFDVQFNRLVEALGLIELVKPSQDLYLKLNQHKVLFKDLI